MSDDFLTVMPGFDDLGLAQSLLLTLQKEGYQEPTPIQAQMIPHVLAKRDVIGQAQTGTGKTAAFALPLLSRLGKGNTSGPRVLVLTPTRELALQVSESFVRYGKTIAKLNVLAVYGGEEYGGQLSKLRRGVDVVVGTPGRIMDHIRRGSLDLSRIETLVLDEADEMLKMGFLDDVEWIVAQAPQERQIALFSATMPDSIRRIASTYQNQPVEISISNKTATAATIEQRFLMVRGRNDKEDALYKILESQDCDGVLIFVRTKVQCVGLADQIRERGFNAIPLNGDIPQSQRQRSVEQLKAGKIDILVATDVAARGLDVERVSHVINFDIPFDTESYIHRIGRTGRAGRDGKAILFLTPREKGMLKNIERATRHKIKPMSLPTVAEINNKRIEKYKHRITETLATDCTFFKAIVDEYCRDNQRDIETVAAALAKMVQGGQPLLLDEVVKQPEKNRKKRERHNSEKKQGRVRVPGEQRHRPEEGMQRYRVEVGEMHGVKPGNIVGAIANEADIDSEFIGRISIFDEFSTVDLPEGMPRALRKVLYNARINGRIMRLSREADSGEAAVRGNVGTKRGRKKPSRGKSHQKAKRKKRTSGRISA